MSEAFSMQVQDVFIIREPRKMILTGVVRSGRVAVGDRLRLTQPRSFPMSLFCKPQVHQFTLPEIEHIEHKELKEADAGMNVGIVLQEFPPFSVKRGALLQAE